MSLLDEARKIPPPRPGRVVSDIQERIDLALAWIDGEITTAQAGKALGCSSSNACTRMLNALVVAVNRKLVKIERV